MEWKLKTAVVVATLTLGGPACAVTFDERWSSLFGVNQITSETVSAKAEVRLSDLKRAERPARLKRHRTYRSRGYRHREWYKGGKRWHYVYSRKRSR